MEKESRAGRSSGGFEHGRIAFARGYGLADIAKREPVTSTSLFRIASISKPITAVAILKLAEENRDEPRRQSAESPGSKRSR
ncbi:MAG: serine hydrolase domain-containing protein [Pirellulales bacterium]